MSFYESDLENKHLFYVRYADDFLLGIKGTKQDAYDTLDKIAQFLGIHLKLQLNPDKTGVKHHRKPTLFLGYKI